jgi:O-antigen ligase
LEKAALTIFLFVLVLGVLLFGAVHTYAYTAVFLGIFIAHGLLIKTNLNLDPKKDTSSTTVLVTALNPLFFSFLVYLSIQIIPLPAGVINFLSPESHTISKMAVPATAVITSGADMDTWSSLAPYSFPVRQSLIRLIAYWLIFNGLIQVLTTRYRIGFAITVVLVLGSFEMLYGLVQTYSGSEHIWWFKKEAHRNYVTGTYLNRNHFSGFMGMGLVLAAAFAAGLARRKRTTEGKTETRNKKKLPSLKLYVSGDHLTNRRMLVLFSGVVMGIGLIFSGSRGGMIATSGAMLLVGLLFLSRPGYRQKGYVLPALFVLIFIYALHIGIDTPMDRFRYLKASYEVRNRLTMRTLEMSGDYPISGVGVGNFLYAYPKYQATEDRPYLIKHAHNDYAQFMAEAGIIGSALLLAGWIYYIYRTQKLWLRRRDPYAVYLGMAPLGVITVIAIHSYSDFNLHIPANCLVLAAILAIGYSALHQQRRFRRERLLYCYRRYQLLSLKGIATLMFIVALVVCPGYWSIRHFMAEAYCNTVSNPTLNREQHPPMHEIKKAIEWDKYNAAYWYKLYEALAGIRDSKTDPVDRRNFQVQIIESIEEAIRLNPMRADYHLKAGWEYSFMWQEADYWQKWIPAADISMERAAYFVGESRPDLHVELGNYWVMRSKSMDPADPGWEPAWSKACWHYKKAQQIVNARELKSVEMRIKHYIRNYYPDDCFVAQALNNELEKIE